MDENTFNAVSQHMEAARQSLRAARQEVQQAILALDGINEMNLLGIRDCKHIIDQLLEHIDLWKSNQPTFTPRKEGDSVQIAGSDIVGKITAVYLNYEASGNTAYAIEMPESAVKDGYLPIEVFYASLLDDAPKTEPGPGRE